MTPHYLDGHQNRHSKYHVYNSFVTPQSKLAASNVYQSQRRITSDKLFTLQFSENIILSFRSE